MHYKRWYRASGAMTRALPRDDFEGRFWRLVDKNGPVSEHRPELGPCWIWTGALNEAGYARVARPTGDGRQKNIRGHRLAYEMLVGPIPEGLTLDHLCRVTRCVNPMHLEPVTDRVNILRGTGVSARAAAKTHCPRGHPYDETNTYWFLTKRGTLGRQCRICRSWHSRNRQSRRKPRD